MSSRPSAGAVNPADTPPAMARRRRRSRRNRPRRELVRARYRASAARWRRPPMVACSSRTSAISRSSLAIGTRTLMAGPAAGGTGCGGGAAAGSALGGATAPSVRLSAANTPSRSAPRPSIRARRASTAA
ncbi:MAG: hypothetical protein LC792_14865 [Actinobacteria bacterium]|nr:hypothetical protein [Actinomycetota bacterium]